MRSSNSRLPRHVGWHGNRGQQQNNNAASNERLNSTEDSDQEDDELPCLLSRNWNKSDSEDDSGSDSEDEVGNARRMPTLPKHRSLFIQKQRLYRSSSIQNQANNDLDSDDEDSDYEESVIYEAGSGEDDNVKTKRLPFIQNYSDEDEDIEESEGEGEDEDEDEGEGEGEDEDEDEDEDSDKEESIPTEAAILSYGLLLVGFNQKRQDRVDYGKNLERFKAHFNVGPKTIRSVYKDLKKDFPSVELNYFLLTLNWFKLYDNEHVLAARWGFCEYHIAKKVKDYARKIQSLKQKKITFDGWEDDEIYIITVDGVNFMTQEFRLVPSTEWFDHKSKSAGLTYEFAIAIRRNKLVWIKGPFPAGKQHDITVFRGGRKEDGKKTWDRNSLYFKIPPGKRAVGDSGYSGEPEKVTVSKDQHQSMGLRRFLARAKNRQESFHSRLKSFGILGQRFRHGRKGTEYKMELHKTLVESICVLVQYDMENGHPLFEV